MSAIKHVCQLDSAGFYVGQVVADESPLEPGVFMIPAGCVDAAPPAISDGVLFRWDASAAEWIAIEERSLAAGIHKQAADHPAGERAVQLLLDAKARDAGYENILAAVSYADETAVPAYAEDGKKFRAWRSVVWNWFYQGEAEHASMTAAQLEPLMPKFGA